jgi:hypothetical protein
MKRGKKANKFFLKLNFNLDRIYPAVDQDDTHGAVNTKTQKMFIKLGD